MMKYHCLFEQSGTFKNEFKKLVYDAYDYDILNDFDETDYKIDLYQEIVNAYDKKKSIFDNFKKGEDFILAFFPCIRFENQCILMFNGEQLQLKNKSDKYKLEYDMQLHEELHYIYIYICKLALVCIEKEIPLVIENPYSTQHYLTRYWCLKPKLIDDNRTLRGDYYKKPTQYWFINCEPKDNFIFEPMINNEVRVITETHDKVQRSMISKEYANRFIREFLIEGE